MQNAISAAFLELPTKRVNINMIWNLKVYKLIAFKSFFFFFIKISVQLNEVKTFSIYYRPLV